MSVPEEDSQVLNDQGATGRTASRYPWAIENPKATGEGVAEDHGVTTHPDTSQAVFGITGEEDGEQESVCPTEWEDVTIVQPKQKEEHSEVIIIEEEEEEEEEDSDVITQDMYKKEEDPDVIIGEEEEEDPDVIIEEEEYERDKEEEDHIQYEKEEGEEAEEDENGSEEEDEEHIGEGIVEELVSVDDSHVEDDSYEDDEGEEEDEERRAQLWAINGLGLMLTNPDFLMAVFENVIRATVPFFLNHGLDYHHDLDRSHPDLLRPGPEEPLDQREDPAGWADEDEPEVFSDGSGESLERLEEVLSGEVEERTSMVRFRETGVQTEATMNYEMGAEAGRQWQLPQPIGEEAVPPLVGVADFPRDQPPPWPEAVLRRIDAVQILQVKYAKIEAQFYKDLYNLEKKYAAYYEPLLAKRRDIVNAIYEPTDAECQWEVGVQKGGGEEVETEPELAEIRGIPHFWLTALKNVKILRKLIQEDDEPILEHLTDVKIFYSLVSRIMGFSVNFFFESNDYFFNLVLTKSYTMTACPDNSNPFFSQGLKIVSSRGCKIFWKKGKNVIKEIPFKLWKSEHQRKSNISNLSFFAYFSPSGPGDRRLLSFDMDRKLGYMFRELLVPRSVLFFTKEAPGCISDKESKKARRKKEEKRQNKEPEGRPKKHLDLGEDSSRESRNDEGEQSD